MHLKKEVLKISGSEEVDVIRSTSSEAIHQKLEDWRTSNVVQMMIESHLSLQKIGRIKQRLFQMNLKALNDYQLRALKKDICTKCTTTISTTLFLCLLVQEQQLCLQRCSSRLGMDLKLILHRTITKSGIKIIGDLIKFQTTLFDVLVICNISFTPLYKGVKTCCF